MSKTEIVKSTQRRQDIIAEVKMTLDEIRGIQSHALGKARRLGELFLILQTDCRKERKNWRDQFKEGAELRVAFGIHGATADDYIRIYNYAEETAHCTTIDEALRTIKQLKDEFLPPQDPSAASTKPTAPATRYVLDKEELPEANLIKMGASRNGLQQFYIVIEPESGAKKPAIEHRDKLYVFSFEYLVSHLPAEK